MELNFLTLDNVRNRNFLIWHLSQYCHHFVFCYINFILAFILLLLLLNVLQPFSILVMFPLFTPYTLPKCFCLQIIWNFNWWFSSSLFNRWKKRPWLLTDIRFCWYWLIRESNLLIFASAALICCFISFLTMLSFFLPMFFFLSSLSLCFFSIFIFSSKLLTKSKSWISSFNFPSYRLFHQGSFFVFGSLLAPTSSEIYFCYYYYYYFYYYYHHHNLLFTVKADVKLFFSREAGYKQSQKVFCLILLLY